MPDGQFYRNGIADEMLFVHEGSGVCRTDLRPTSATARATTSSCRSGRPGGWIPDEGSEQRILYLEAPSEIEPPKRYRNDYGQLLEHSPYSQRDIHCRRAPEPRADEGEFVIHVARATGSRRTTTATTRSTSSAGTAISGRSASTSPTSSRSPAASTSRRRSTRRSQARNFVVCSFVPRKFDYHPLAIPAPYNHSNINSDEVIYYVAGNFMSRRGVEISSFTVHPAGIPHGPHPGTVEASIGKEATEELAVMVDTFHPLFVTQAAMDLDDAGLPVQLAAARGRPRAEASELAERGPEAFPD